MSRRTNEYNNLWPYNLLAPPEYLEFNTLYAHYFNWLLELVFKIFDFEGLPDTFNEIFLKYTLFINGKVCVFRADNGDLLALNCAYTDTPNVYYIPSKIIVNNPRLTKSYILTPGEDCAVIYLSETDIYNSAQAGGMYELLRSTATLLADNDISINVAQKNTRLVNFISADTQNVYNSVQAALTQMYAGKPNVVVKSSLVDKLQSIPILQTSSTNQNIVQLIQLKQYILSHFYECIGLSTHDQMKKERLITAEINDNIDLARFNIDDMYTMIKSGIDVVNQLFDTNITVEVNKMIMDQFEKEPEAEAEPEAEPEEEPEAEPEPEPEEEPEAEPEPDAEPTINNTIIIQVGGEDNAAAADVGADSGADAGSRDQPI